MDTVSETTDALADFGFGEGFDPFAEEDESGEEIEIEGMGTFPMPSDEQARKVVEAAYAHVASLSPVERIGSMLDRLSGRRPVLLEVIRYCEKPRMVSEVESLIDDFQASNASVYSASSLCVRLLDAGALTLFEADPLPPRIVEVDGVEYLEPVRASEGIWQSTPDGLAAVAAAEKGGRLRGLFDQTPAAQEIYLRILACCNEAPRSMAELSDLLRDEPSLERLGKQVSWFVEHLEAADALVWQGSWKTTMSGSAALEEK